MWNEYKKLHKKNCSTQLGVQALLRSEIIRIYNKCVDRHCIHIYELENLKELYQQYKNLGGNGVIDDLMTRLRELPTPNEIK